MSTSTAAPNQPPQQSTGLDSFQAFPLHARPTCPTILIPFEKELYSLPIHQLHVSAEFHVSTAFVKVEGIWRNIAIFPSDCMFVLPLNGTVTKVSIKVSSRVFETLVLPKSQEGGPADKDKKGKKNAVNSSLVPASATAAATDEPANAFEHYIPNLFRLPIPNVNSGEEISVTVHYMEPLFYFDQQYNITLPLKFGANLLADGKTFDDTIKVRCTINAVTPSTKWACASHNMKILKSNNPQQIELLAVNIEGDMERLNPEDEEELAHSRNFSFAYSLSSENILCTLIKEEAKESEYNEGTFVLFVTPPSLDNMTHHYSRDIVFLLDRSGSMTGDPFVEATRAISAALENLTPLDRFTIIAFDHRQVFFSPNLVVASTANVQHAALWVQSQKPERGGTDIETPMSWSLKHLNNLMSSHSQLPFVVLLTDGCVDREREICKNVGDLIGNVRVLTFGIGFYCNWYFLKILAQLGRGFTDVVVYKEKIYNQMLQLLNMAAIPVLTNVNLEIKGAGEIEMWPDPIPDLFMGAPLTITGKYTGVFPDQVTLKATNGDGSVFTMVAETRSSDVIPVSKVFLRQRIDLLTAQAWLQQSPILEEQVVDVSCTYSMPSPYTKMVAFETTEEQKKKLDALLNREIEMDGIDDREDAKMLSRAPSLPRSSSANDQVPKKQKWYRNPKIVAGLAVGPAVVVGALAFSFGDVLSTISNVPVASTLGEMFDDGFQECCGGCGGELGQACDCENVCSSLGDCML